jgi:hypothetical protein
MEVEYLMTMLRDLKAATAVGLTMAIACSVANFLAPTILADERAEGIPPDSARLDLARIDRTIRKEPVYRTKPRYALLVLGPKAETRMWLVIDGKTLYVDRNGNGNLTEKGEQVDAEKTESTDILEFRVGDFMEADGKTKHSTLAVSQYTHFQLGKLVNTVAITGVFGGLAQTTNGEDGCSFGISAKDAPIIHFNGPLTLKVKWVGVDYPGGSKLLKEAPYRLEAGDKVSQLHVQVGSPGIGPETFAALAMEKRFPVDLHPLVEIRALSKADPKKPVKTSFFLKERC